MTNTQDNIDKLIQLASARLNSSGKMKSQDQNGSVIYVEASIFSSEQMTSFLTISLSNFNQTPLFTNFTFADTEIIDIFADILVEGAVLQALGAQALLERGRESSGGVPFNSPNMSDLLNHQYQMLLDHHERKLQLIKRDFHGVASTLGSPHLLYAENGCLKWRNSFGTITTLASTV